MKLRWRTHPRIARAQLECWQSEKQLWLFERIAVLVRLADRYGLERARIARVLKTMAQAMEKRL